MPVRCCKWRMTFAGKLDRPIQTRSDGRAAEREFFQRVDGLLRAFLRIGDLLRVTAETLAEPDRRRIHQMRAPDFDDVGKFLRLFGQRFLQFAERGQQLVLQLLRRADVDRGWDHIVARLPHVDVIVRMNALLRIDRSRRRTAGSDARSLRSRSCSCSCPNRSGKYRAGNARRACPRSFLPRPAR